MKTKQFLFCAVSLLLVAIPVLPQTAPPTASLQYPDGISGITPVIARVSQSSPFTVPAGQNLYINNIPRSSPLCGPAGGFCFMTVTGGSNLLSGFAFVHMASPIVVGSQAVLSSTSPMVTFDIQGFLVPATVQVVIADIGPAGSYSVPAGKNLYLLNTGITNLAAKNSLTVDGVEITMMGNMFNAAGPVIVPSGHSITNQGTATITIDGYLQ